MKIKPFVQMPPIWVGGQAHALPPLFAILQVHGTFKSRQNPTMTVKYRSASLTRSAQFVKPIYAVENYTEAEWIAIYAGIVFASENNEKTMIIENDSLGNIHTLSYATR